jgi:hypothetical protein
VILSREWSLAEALREAAFRERVKIHDIVLEGTNWPCANRDGDVPENSRSYVLRLAANRWRHEMETMDVDSAACSGWFGGQFGTFDQKYFGARFVPLCGH